ncbi:hypothetical protein [Paenibacillus sp. BIC5C1]|uniref:hypothetical protein n=1 Tax=Paenibacillus sp. BIC5C1 TaxID=3078263 RepID=UPI0028E4B960|nr:hypothetical protein [Paenibacillus sp. BIC5C1]
MNKVSLERRKEHIAELQNEIKLQEHAIKVIGTYSPNTLEEKILHLYSIEGSVKIVADQINAEGHRIGERKYITNDITAVIESKPVKDELHEIVKKAFNQNKKKAAARWF